MSSDEQPRRVRSNVLSVRVYDQGRDKVDSRAHAENGGDRSAWLRRAIDFAERHMPHSYQPPGARPPR